MAYLVSIWSTKGLNVAPLTLLVDQEGKLIETLHVESRFSFLCHYDALMLRQLDATTVNRRTF